MLTLFAMPKPFNGHIGIIQRNAIESWRRLHSDIQIVLFGNESGVADIANEFSLTHIPSVERNDLGTPYVSDLFAQARQHARFDTLCYVNGDIILLNDFIQAVERVQQWQTPFLLVGQRWNVDLDHVWDFEEVSWERNLRQFTYDNGSAHGVTGIDYFAFPKTFATELPPFLVGRPRWDNYFIYYARQSNIPVIDVTPANLAIHQNHSYGHVPQATGKKWMGPEADYNISLSNTYTYLFTLDAADWLMTENAIRRKRSYAHLRQSLNAWFSYNFPNLRNKLTRSYNDEQM